MRNDIARYSASAEDLLTVGCFLVFQATEEVPSCTRNPVTRSLPSSPTSLVALVTPSSSSPEPSASVPAAAVNPSVAEPQQALRRNQRQRTQSVMLKDFVVDSIQKKSQEDCGQVSAYPIDKYVTCDRFSSSHCAYLVAISTEFEPQTFKTAVQYERWRRAMGGGGRN